MPTHLVVDLFDTTQDPEPQVKLEDERDGIYFDLNTRGFHDKTARIIIAKGPDYRLGDHVQLLDEATELGATDIVSIDPDINADVDLNRLLHGSKDTDMATPALGDQRNFADRASALRFILNPNADGSFRLRVRLYDTVQQPDDYPSLVLYDWQFEDTQFVADLNRFHFADKAAGVWVKPGPNATPLDRVFLRDRVLVAEGIPIDPARGRINLNETEFLFADKTAAVFFDLGK